jgi:hypothetical protein
MAIIFPYRQRAKRFMEESTGMTPAPIPPHPPLVSGGWYQGLSPEEVLGPGRYPVEPPGDKSVVTALLLTLLFGPAGLCYVTVMGGLICSVLTATAVALLGFEPLLIAWPLTMVCASILAAGMHAEHQAH